MLARLPPLLTPKQALQLAGGTPAARAPVRAAGTLLFPREHLLGDLYERLPGDFRVVRLGSRQAAHLRADADACREGGQS